MSAQTAVSIFAALPKDEQRFWEEERRIVRSAINGAKEMPRRRREALMFLSNLWFHHRNVKGVIYPGAEKIADKLECSVRTAKTILKELRDEGFIIPVDYEKGGSRTTRYVVDLGKIVEMRPPRGWGAEESFDRILRTNRAHINRAISLSNRAKIARGKGEKAQVATKPVRETFDDPSDWVEVPF